MKKVEPGRAPASRFASAGDAQRTLANQPEESLRVWKHLYLAGGLARGILRAAVRDGYVTIPSAQTADEDDQVKRFLRSLNPSRSARGALELSLIFDRVYLDEETVNGGLLFKDLSDADPPDESGEIECRPIVAFSEGVSEFLQIESVHIRALVDVHGMPPSSRANLFAFCEPLIWGRFKSEPRVSRDLLRDLLDVYVLHPDALDTWFAGTFDGKCEGLPITASLRDSFRGLASKYVLDHAALQTLAWVFYMIRIRGAIAVQQLRKAEMLEAVYPATGLRFGKARSSFGVLAQPPESSAELLGFIRIFLDEIEWFPVVDTFSRLLSIREHPEFTRFRAFLRLWVTALRGGDRETEAGVRREIADANRLLRKAVTCAKVGRYFTYLALPMTVLDILVAPVFGAAATLCSLGLQAVGDWQSSKGGWILVGWDPELH